MDNIKIIGKNGNKKNRKYVLSLQMCSGIFINTFHYIQQSLIVSDAVETNLKVHKKFNSAFESVGEPSSKAPKNTKKRKLSK